MTSLTLFLNTGPSWTVLQPLLVLSGPSFTPVWDVGGVVRIVMFSQIFHWFHLHCIQVSTQISSALTVDTNTQAPPPPLLLAWLCFPSLQWLLSDFILCIDIQSVLPTGR